MEGWSRGMYCDETGLPWVMPSPNMPTLDTAIVYPGTVLFEGTMISEGRGTTRPFELIGAPWIDAELFAAAMNARHLDGAHFRPAVFEPTFQKHARTPCGGCQIHVLDRSAFSPCATAAALLLECYRTDPARFEWRQPPYDTRPPRCRSTSLPALLRCASRSKRRCRSRTSSRAGRRMWRLSRRRGLDF